MNTKVLHKPHSKTCSFCGKPRLYAGSRRCTCGDLIGFLPVAPMEQVRQHLEYLTRELACIENEPPQNITEYLSGLRAYVCRVMNLLPVLETEEEGDPL